MKTINAKLSNESYKVISDYKLDKNLKTLEKALEKILKEYKNAKSKNI